MSKSNSKREGGWGIREEGGRRRDRLFAVVLNGSPRSFKLPEIITFAPIMTNYCCHKGYWWWHDSLTPGMRGN